MKQTNSFADQLHCPSCGSVIPNGSSKCTNPQCPTNKPLRAFFFRFVNNKNPKL